MAKGEFTPTEQRILKLLSDGQRHKRKEIHACLFDELSELKTIRYHICMMRKVLRPKGEDIICEMYMGGLYYRHVRLLASAYDGVK